jgi:hypothetical protein
MGIKETAEDWGQRLVICKITQLKRNWRIAMESRKILTMNDLIKAI